MEKLFNPESIVIYGLSSKESNIPRLILENLIRWGFEGRIFGVNPSSKDSEVNGIKMYRAIDELPIVPDLAVSLIPARFVPATIEACGKFGIKWMAIPSGGFNELGEEGKKLAQDALDIAKKYNVRFVGPNGVTVANTANGLCLPFVPSYSPPKGGFSVITQSGGVGLMLWNLMTDEDVGMAKFASIGNKLNLDEVDFLEYFGRDPETKVIGLYLESIPRGRDLIKVAEKINKPILILKSNTSEAGKKAAMSHTAAVSNNDAITDSAFERAGIIRIKSFAEFISVAKAFKLPPMKGNKMMVMSPAGGFTVMMADLCEEIGFEFANPGEDFYENLKKFSNAGIVNLSNPLDMGDIYDPQMYAHIFFSVMHNENVDGAIYVSQWPNMPKGNDVFSKMFHTDLSKETIGAIMSSGKPLGIALFGISKTISKIKQNLSIPIFDTPEEMILALKKQMDYYKKKKEGIAEIKISDDIPVKKLKEWLNKRQGVVGEETLEFLELAGVPVANSAVAASVEEAVKIAEKLSFPVVMKVVSPDAVHKSDAGGVIVGIDSIQSLKESFEKIKNNLYNYNANASFEGVRIMQMARDGYDMFIGSSYDDSFGSAVSFGYGGIYIEVFKDVKNVLSPAPLNEIEKKVEHLKSYKIISGTRGKESGDIKGYIKIIERISHLTALFPEIKEMDINPVRILEDGTGVLALDGRMKIGD